jgi:tRNA pseudouridine55 synthase
MDGILLVHKEKGYTSRDVVNIVGKHLKTRKVGHTGTLDPMATGVLVICVGKATKLVDIITNKDKEYIAEVTLGLLTDTLDITGKVIKEEVANIKKENILKVIDSFNGEYEQEVPIYSAVKINGKKLYEYVRNNEKVELPKRIVNIKKLELIDDVEYKDDKTIFKIKCLVSKGTYIRSLINDIAQKLNTIGVMSELIRTKQGIINLDDCFKIDDIINNNYHLIDIRACIPNIKQIVVDEKLESDIRNGKIFNNVYGVKEMLFIDKSGNILALYHEYEKDTNKIKPWKMFI